MYYVGNCRCCGQGLLGIRICCDDEIGLVVCEECEAIWLEPTCTGEPLSPESPGSLCPRCGRSLWDPPSHWAAEDEVERLDWAGFVQGEWQSGTPQPRLARIDVYPIKSLHSICVDSVAVLPSGALQNDRRWKMVDREGRTVNGKRTPAVHRVQFDFDLQREIIWLETGEDSQPRAFHMSEDRVAVEQRLSDLLGITVRLVEDCAAGFPDDSNAPGPTVISTATIQEVASWFKGLTPNQIRSRFRANLEIDGVPAFWEDRLFGAADQEIPFSIGTVPFAGVNPCRRCVVPTRSAETGEVTAAFAMIFADRREKSLPDWAPRGRFDPFYRLAVNTRRLPPLEMASIQIDDPVGCEREAPRD